MSVSLNPGGIFVFSQPPAIPSSYGPQGMYKGGFAGPAMFAYRYSYTPEAWEDFLREAGFVDVGLEHHQRQRNNPCGQQEVVLRKLLLNHELHLGRRGELVVVRLPLLRPDLHAEW